MKAKLLLAFFAISSVALAQDRGRGIQREEGRQQNNAYSYSNHSYKGAESFYRLDLSYAQKNELLRLLGRKEREAKILRRSYKNANKKLSELEYAYDVKISRLLNRSQYNAWTRYYAAQYSVESNSYRYV